MGVGSEREREREREDICCLTYDGKFLGLPHPIRFLYAMRGILTRDFLSREVNPEGRHPQI